MKPHPFLILFALLSLTGAAWAQSAATSSQAASPLTETAATPEAPPETANLTIPQLIDEAGAALASGNALLAKSLAQTVLQRDESNVEAMLIDADVALLEGDADRARLRFRTVLEVQPTDFLANFGIGKLYWRGKVFRQATWYLEKARDVAPSDKLSEVLTLLSRSYRGSGYGRQALETVIEAIRADQRSLEAWEWLVKLRTEGEDYDQALIESDQLVKLAREAALNDPADRATIERLFGAYTVQHGVLWAKQRTFFQPTPDGNYSELLLPGMEQNAAENLRRIIDLRIVQAELLRTLSYFELVEFARKAIEFDPSNVNAQIQYGLLLRNISDHAGARAAFQAALAVDPANAEAQRQLASLPPDNAPSLPPLPPASQPAPAGPANPAPAPPVSAPPAAAAEPAPALGDAP